MSTLLRCYGYYELFETLNFHLQLASYSNYHLYIKFYIFLQILLQKK